MVFPAGFGFNFRNWFANSILAKIVKKSGIGSPKSEIIVREGSMAVGEGWRGSCLGIASLRSTSVSRRFGDSIPAAAVKNRVELARSAPHSFHAASPFPCGRRQKDEHRGRDNRKAGTLPCLHACSCFSVVCRWHLFVLLLVPYLMEFILILAFTSAIARMRAISTSLSAWWTFWLTSFT